MSYIEADRDLARRHVCEGSARVVRQRELIARMNQRGQATDGAETLLTLLEQTQGAFEEHLREIEAQLSAS
jgi:hypothetical protein